MKQYVYVSHFLSIETLKAQLFLRLLFSITVRPLLLQLLGD